MHQMTAVSRVRKNCAAAARRGQRSPPGQKFVPAGVGILFSHRRGKRSPARRDKLSRRVRLKWSRRDGSLTIDIRGVDPPLRVPPVSGDPVSDERNAPSPPAPPPTRGEGRRLEAGRALGVLGLRCAPTQAIAVAPCWG